MTRVEQTDVAFLVVTGGVTETYPSAFQLERPIPGRTGLLAAQFRSGRAGVRQFLSAAREAVEAQKLYETIPA